MAEKKLRPGQKVRMVSVDELLGVEGEESSLELEIAKIQPFQNHPFKVVDDDKMEELVNSIRQNGVLTPVLVNWIDEENRAYVLYPIRDIQEDMGVSKKKAIAALAELEGFGLVEKRVRGMGLPNLLYIKNVAAACK